MHVNISNESLLSDNNWPKFAGRVCNSDKQPDKQILCHFQRKGNLLLDIVIALRNPRILLEMYLSLTHQLISRWPIAWALFSPKSSDSLFSKKTRLFPQELEASVHDRHGTLNLLGSLLHSGCYKCYMYAKI